MSDYQAASQKYIDLRRQGLSAREAFSQAFPQGLQRAQAESLAEETNDAALGQALGIASGAIGAKGAYNLVTEGKLFPETFEALSNLPDKVAGWFGSSSTAPVAEAGTSIITEGAASGAGALEAGGLFGGGQGAVGGAPEVLSATRIPGTPATPPVGGVPIGVPLAALAIALGPEWAPGFADTMEKNIAEPVTEAGRKAFASLGLGAGPKTSITNEAYLDNPHLERVLPSLGDVPEEQRAQVVGGLREAGVLKDVFAEDPNQAAKDFYTDEFYQKYPTLEGQLSAAAQNPTVFNPVLDPLNMTGQFLATQDDYAATGGRTKNAINSSAALGLALQRLGVDPMFGMDSRRANGGAGQGLGTFIDGNAMWQSMDLEERLGVIDQFQAQGGEVPSNYAERIAQARGLQGGLTGALGVNPTQGIPQTPSVQPEAIQRPLIEAQGGSAINSMALPLYSAGSPLPEWVQNYYRENPEDFQNRGTAQLDIGAALLGLR